MSYIVSFTDGRENLILKHLNANTRISEIENILTEKIDDGQVIGLVIAGKQCKSEDYLRDYSYNKDGVSILCLISKSKIGEKTIDDHQLSIKMKEIQSVKEHVDLCIKNYNNPLNFELRRDVLKVKAEQRSSDDQYPIKAKEFFKAMKESNVDSFQENIEISKPEPVIWSKLLDYDIDTLMSEASEPYPDYNDLSSLRDKFQSINREESKDLTELCNDILKNLKETHNRLTKDKLKISLLEIYDLLEEVSSRPDISVEAKEGIYDFHDQIIEYNSNEEMDVKKYNILMKNLKDVELKVDFKLENLKKLKSKHNDFQLNSAFQSLKELENFKKEDELHKTKYESDLKKVIEKQKELKGYYLKYYKDLDFQIKQREDLTVNYKEERSFIKTLILELLQRYVQNKNESNKLEKEISDIKINKNVILSDSTNEDILIENYKILLENKINDSLTSFNSYKQSETVIKSCLSKVEERVEKNKNHHDEQRVILLHEKFKLNSDVYALLYSEHQRYKHLLKLEVDDIPRIRESIESRKMLGDSDGVEEYESVIKKTQEKNKQIEIKIREIEKRIDDIKETLKEINEALTNLGRTPLPEPHEEAEELCKSRFGSIIL